MRPRGPARRARAARWLAAAVLVTAGVACRRDGPATVTEHPVAESAASASARSQEARPAPLARIGVIGASVSAGYGDGIPLHELIALGAGTPPRIFDGSSSAIFLRTGEIGRVERHLMELRGVELVVAVDFLFWFAYGDKPTEAREADLEEGLTLLDGLDVPILVGDLPDVRGASPEMIAPAQIPSASELAGLNARIQRWSDDRPRVHLLPMAAWTGALRSGAAIRVGGAPLAEGPPLLQWDGLHPTGRGQAVLACLVVEALDGVRPGWRTTTDAVDPDALLARWRSARALGDLPPPPSR